MEQVRRFLREAPACSLFMVACVVVYLVTAAQTGRLDDPVGTGPTFGSPLAWDLMMVAPEVTDHGEWWRLLTSALVHLNLIHLLMNMLVIGLVGRVLERSYGTAVTAVAMVVCAAGGGAAALWLEPGTAVGGASTVAYGLFAMLVGDALHRGTDVRAPLILIAINLVYSLTGGVSLAGHLGGLVSGAVVVLVLWLWRRLRGARATSSPSS
jgi:rhomboid protease GluP